MKEHFLEITAWGSFLLTIITPENISIIAGAASLLLSTTGILLNLIKIYKNTKNNEKTN
jgi:hypothetical protein